MSTDIAALVKQSVVRELESLRDAVRDLAGPLDERRFWTMPLEPGNSFGHLVLHLTGNLNWFVGAAGRDRIRPRTGARIHRDQPPDQGGGAGRPGRGGGDLPARGRGADRRATGRPASHGVLWRRGQRPGAFDLALRVTPRTAFLHRPARRRQGHALSRKRRPIGKVEPFRPASFIRSSYTASFYLRGGRLAVTLGFYLTGRNLRGGFLVERRGRD